jgi:hypothetical protein
MPASKKTLAEFVAGRTFLARRHSELLDSDPLLPKGPLRKLQLAYRAEESELERTQIAREFEHAVHSFEPAELSDAQFFYAGMGPAIDFNGIDATALGLRGARGKIDWDGLARLQRRWTWWDGRHGMYWRASHGIPHNIDKLKLVHRLTGRRLQNVETAGAELEARAKALDLLLRAHGPTSDPPGWELLDRG